MLPSRNDPVPASKALVVIKRDIHGQETWRYSGRLLRQEGSRIILEAFFDRQDMDIHGLLLGRGDRFIETYYTDRWYNIFEVRAREDGRLRGWYCNIASPAVLDGDTLSYTDFALDLIVFPDGRQIVLDEDEFSRLPLSPAARAQAIAALAELQTSFQTVSEQFIGSLA